MQRSLYSPDHEAYRETVREFLTREVVPNQHSWDQERWIDRTVFSRAAKAGVYALQIDEQYGGAGEPDYRYRMVVCEEVARVNALSFGLTLSLQDDLVLHYLLDLTNEEQKQQWLPGFASGELIGALAMTEPEAGSDLRGIRTAARRVGDTWVLNGQKTFISSGIMADVVVVAARTNPEGGSRAFSLFVVERDTPGFERGRKLDKVGLPAQDTAELYFRDATVPAANLLGEEGRGLQYLMSHLPRERLGVTAKSIATTRAIFEMTVEYCKQRKAFGAPLTDKQHIRFELAEMSTEIDIAQTYADRSVLAYNAGELSPIDAAKGKWYMSELQKRVLDRCLQLHGGYGYMTEYPVARAYLDTRVQTIYGGTTEIMKEIIGRSIAAGS
ncbi:acyl-CoA dehydrogenase [Mycobacteroides abscessus subsp. abscessus]|uniref:Acyl-CoA dehydrogenase n=1 Tax=Mycobacteroides abscessus TaxID=36809 RepID=A0A0U0ZP66_9MYCO|nr:acyl-CoA dehydrogenase family protein [Mycobacteroides abscessus]AKP60802.1 acyl-CoA dehydrogenase [Mycobacteroides abscessus UC22]EHM22087.1 acyl-CoA dehydrogenase [Mycobacteroides abscessus subsp. bolletii BD]MBL3735985.1 acyl-CoA dehydrogenase family protein [Mycobacteroides abscessus subsp. massiliense]MBL3745558.1 acyl-CoA dehydrogenase family protein [Mycobacteroides abscessus subsp. massiliense]MBL3760667.1 acyl-CoA dehydrogenase family protein [Mycobacteroides abscessus subsp. massi